MTGWADSLQPYLKSTQIFQCPSETNPPGGTSTSGMTPNSTGLGYTDYMANVYDINDQTGMVGLIAPVQTVLACDWRSSVSGSSFAYNYNWSTGMPADNGQVDEWRRHLSGDNFLFSDGHVKWLKLQNVLSRNAYPCGAIGTGSPLNTTYTFCAE